MPDRETLEVDVLIVGAGPAGLSAALRLAHLQRAAGGEALSIAVLEKAREAGAHMLSGAVLDPSTLRDLVPDFEAKGAPLAAPVHDDRVYFLTAGGKIKFPITPPPLVNHGNYVISLNKFVKWLAGLVEAEGIDLFTGFPGAHVLMEGDRVLGVRTGDRGRGKHGEPKGTFEPGVDIHAKVTIFADGGQMVRYGAKALPEGGWHTIPRCYANGALIVGDAAGFMNSMRLKGIHLAMRSGMHAADTAFDAVRAKDTSAVRLQSFEAKINAGPIRRELYPVRNVHQAFGYGLLAGLTYSGLSLVTGGWWPRPMHSEPGRGRMQKIAGYHGRRGRAVPDGATSAIKPDRPLTFDKLTNVHYSGTRHDEDQPVHLLVHTDVCHTICTEEYGNPCQRFCPANVYEMIVSEGAGKQLQINASNCVHCKTCDIMDPYQVITWVTPEGGGGPQYDGM